MALLRPNRLGALLRVTVIVGLVVISTGAVEKAELSLASSRYEAEVIDLATACELVRDYAGSALYSPRSVEVSCPTLERTAGVLRLPGVRLASRSEVDTRTFCVVRGWRWFVLASPEDGVCPEHLPPRSFPRPATVAQLAAHEEQLRAQERDRAGGEVLATVEASLERARKGLASHEHVERRCEALQRDDGLPGAMTIPFVDRDALSEGAVGSRGDDGRWRSLLTSSPVSEVLDERTARHRRLAAAAALRPKPYLAVVESVPGQRSYPRVGDAQEMHGTFSGWLAVVDLRTGEVVCEAHLHFESTPLPELLTAKSLAANEFARNAVTLLPEDLRRSFHAAADERVDWMTAGVLRLGWR